MALPKLNETPNKDGDMEVVDVQGIKQLKKLNQNVEKLTKSLLTIVTNKSDKAPESLPENSPPAKDEEPTLPAAPAIKKGSFAKGFFSGLFGVEDIVNKYTGPDKEKILTPMEEERQAKAKKEAKLASKTAITPTVAAAPTTPTETPPKEKPEVMAVGKDKLDPRNPLDAKILEAINKQLEKEKAADSQKESTPQVESSKTIPSPTISPVAPIETASAITPTMDKGEVESTSEIVPAISKLQSSFDNLAASLTTFPTNIKSLEKTLQETFGKLDKSLLKKSNITSYARDEKGRFISNKSMAAVNMIDKPISASGIEPTDITAKDTEKEQDRELLAQAIADKLSEVLGGSGGIGLSDIGDIVPDGKSKGGKTPGKPPSKIAGKLATLGKIGAPIAGALTIGATAYEGYSDYQDAQSQLEEGKITPEEANTKKGEAVGRGTGGVIGAGLGMALGTPLGPLGIAAGGYFGSKLGEAAGEYIGHGASQTGPGEFMLDPESAAMSSSMESTTEPTPVKPPRNGSSPMRTAPQGAKPVTPKVEPAVVPTSNGVKDYSKMDKQKMLEDASKRLEAMMTPADVTKAQKLLKETRDNTDLKSSTESKSPIQPIITSSVTTNNNKDTYIPVAPRPRNEMNSIERYMDKVR